MQLYRLSAKYVANKQRQKIWALLVWYEDLHEEGFVVHILPVGVDAPLDWMRRVVITQHDDVVNLRQKKKKCKVSLTREHCQPKQLVLTGISVLIFISYILMYCSHMTGLAHFNLEMSWKTHSSQKLFSKICVFPFQHFYYT